MAISRPLFAPRAGATNVASVAGEFAVWRLDRVDPVQQAEAGSRLKIVPASPLGTGRRGSGRCRCAGIEQGGRRLDLSVRAAVSPPHPAYP
jgi:hypothetical protein